MKLAYFCIAALLATPLAQAAPRDISAEIAAQRADFVSAKVYHLLDGIEYLTDRSEAYTTTGCFIPATGADLSALLDVLTTGLHESEPPSPIEPPSYTGFDVRTVIYLARADGSTVPLLLSLRGSGTSVYGSYERSVRIEADATFATALHDWIDRHQRVDPVTGKPCSASVHIH